MKRAVPRGHMRSALDGRLSDTMPLRGGAVARAEAPDRVRRNMPDPIPVMVIGRLAIDAKFQGRGVGPALLRDAILRTLQASEIAGIRAILVHAISERAKRFYEKWGFTPSPVDPMTLKVTVKEAAKMFAMPTDPANKI